MKKLREENETINDLIYEEARSCSESTTTSDSYHEIKNKWHSAEDVRKVPKCNIQKQRMLQPTHTNDATLEREGSKRNSDKSIDRFVPNKQLTKVLNELIFSAYIPNFNNYVNCILNVDLFDQGATR